ncbi:cation:proton antiporter [Sorangium cellulosum]|uniref:Cation:proton antiporter n=1 Tax=Sorangium cellulosum TaxID=56 RepID=A0A2L0ERZ3_SORCE|nr:monovalent cation/H+ antiporter complex subunit F [Sorangium cellulosum]AUX42059.1 cation:proton antiporter [Sorangium cellulosum]
MGSVDPRSAVLFASLFVLGAGVALCTIRIARGPTHFDRLLAFDCLLMNVVGVALQASILLETDAFMEVVLVAALFGFIGTISLAAYLEGSFAR